jgi:hypothetical protein
MINLRDPTLCQSTDYEETDTTTHAGYVSTLVIKLGSVEEGARPEARQHKTDAICQGTSRGT